MAKLRKISTQAAPGAIGPYSQAIALDSLVFLSGQIPLEPATMTLVEGGIREQAVQVFENLSAVAKASGGSLADIVKLTIYLTDLGDFPVVNEIMSSYFSEPYPARATIAVSALPRSAAIEVDAILAL
ncbi:MAG: hypothetical protein RLZZ385_168 [Pseudomonadota bacterium]|jgi:reactive intermediate/imine deaminase